MVDEVGKSRSFGTGIRCSQIGPGGLEKGNVEAQPVLKPRGCIIGKTLEAQPVAIGVRAPDIAGERQREHRRDEEDDGR